jgi:membrane protein
VAERVARHPQLRRTAGAAIGGLGRASAKLAAVPGASTARRIWSRLSSDDVGMLAPALAYHFFLALFPFAVFVTTVSATVARVFGLPDVAVEMLAFLGRLPPAVSALLEQQLQAIMAANVPRLLSLSALGAIWVATAGTNTLLYGVDRAYGVSKARRGMRRQLLATGLTILAGWALVCSFLAVTLVAVFGHRLVAALGLPDDLLAEGMLVVWPLTGGLVLLAAAGLYRVAPSVAPPWRRVLPGAGLFAGGWLIGTAGYSIYATYFANYSLTYGALASVVALLVWLYLTSFLLLAGAVLNATLGEPATTGGSSLPQP